MSKNSKIILGVILCLCLLITFDLMINFIKKNTGKDYKNTNSANSNINNIIKDENTLDTNDTTINNVEDKNTSVVDNVTYQIQEFVRTYTVEKIIHSQEENSYYLTLSIFQGEVDTVLVDLSNYSLKEGNTYEFRFSKKENIEIDDTIDSIFKNCSIVSITKTNKKGLEQKQDSIN